MNQKKTYAVSKALEKTYFSPKTKALHEFAHFILDNEEPRIKPLGADK